VRLSRSRQPPHSRISLTSRPPTDLTTWDESISCFNLKFVWSTDCWDEDDVLFELYSCTYENTKYRNDISTSKKYQGGTNRRLVSVSWPATNQTGRSWLNPTAPSQSQDSKSTGLPAAATRPAWAVGPTTSMRKRQNAIHGEAGRKTMCGWWFAWHVPRVASEHVCRRDEDECVWSVDSHRTLRFFYARPWLALLVFSVNTKAQKAQQTTCPWTCPWMLMSRDRK
jgi:hypothetical protein